MPLRVTQQTLDVDTAVHITLLPEQMTLGETYEVPTEAGSVLRVRMVDKQTAHKVITYRFDVVAVVSRRNVEISEVPTTDE